jgi:hypothetical protein
LEAEKSPTAPSGGDRRKAMMAVPATRKLNRLSASRVVPKIR